MTHVNSLISFLNTTTEAIHSLFCRTWAFAFLIGSVLLLGGTAANIDIVNSMAVGILLLITCFLICEKVYKNKAMTLLAMAALMLRFLISFIFNYVFKSFGMDSVQYHHLASDISVLLDGGVSYISIPFLFQYFPNFVAVIYFALGINRLSATFIIGFFSVVTGVFIYLTCQTSKIDRRVGFFSSLAIWFMPGFLFFMSDLLKDSSILMLTALSFYLFSLLSCQKNSILSNVVLTLVLAIIIAINSALRFYVFAPIIISFVFVFVFYLFQKRGLYKLLFGVLLFGFFALFYALSSKYLDGYMSMDINELFVRINDTRQYGYANAAAGIKGYDISTFIKALKAIPMLCVHYIAQPFPSSWLLKESEFYVRLLIPDMIAWYLMLPFMIYGVYYVLLKKNVMGISMVMYLFVFLLLNALVIGNVGAIYRYRLQFQELAFVITGIGALQLIKSRVKFTPR